jgi:hypothetical protein
MIRLPIIPLFMDMDEKIKMANVEIDVTINKMALEPPE